MTRFLFACDSFNGTLSSAQSAQLLTEEMRSVFPDATSASIEVADGGEGTVSAVVGDTRGETMFSTMAEPPGRPV